MKIIWSEQAVIDYHQNIDYILTHWTETSAHNFIEDVQSVLALIQLSPQNAEGTYQSIRRDVISKHVTLFYKVESNTIFLVRFWNTIKSPSLGT